MKRMMLSLWSVFPTTKMAYQSKYEFFPPFPPFCSIPDSFRGVISQNEGLQTIRAEVVWFLPRQTTSVPV